MPLPPAAERFTDCPCAQHNKKREELHRLKERYPEQAARMEAKHRRDGFKGTRTKAQSGSEEEDDSSSTEDEEIGIIPAKTEAQILDTLHKIKSKDISIYDSQAKFYSSSDDDDEEEEEEEEEKEKQVERLGSKQKKAIYLKDVTYQQALSGAAFSEEDDDEDDHSLQPTYIEEQKKLKEDLLNALEDAGHAGEEFFLNKTKEKSGDPEHRGGSMDEARIQDLLDKYFGEEEAALDEGDRFLKQYILKKGWVDKDSAEGSDEEGEEDHPDTDEDEAYLKAADNYEHAYNFRYEEPGAERIITHPRTTDGIVRKEDDRRKKKRQEKKERLAAEEDKRRSELRRLKNLKKQEIEERLQEIGQVAGAAAPPPEALDALLAGDFDPEEYDKAMAAAFDDSYYDEAEADESEDLLDEEFEKELEKMAKYESDDDEDEHPHPEKAHLSTFSKLQKTLPQSASDSASRSREDILRLLEEYYKLEYEDVVGGVPTRFRYRQVPAQDFGLRADDILTMDEKELNQIIGLKRLAPYREDWQKQRVNYSALQSIQRERHDVSKSKKAKEVRMEASKAVLGMTEEERRLASYAKPTLKKRGVEGDPKKTLRKPGEQIPGPNAKKTKKTHEQGQQRSVPSATTGMSKAQKKNLKRTMKRASRLTDRQTDTQYEVNRD